MTTGTRGPVDRASRPVGISTSRGSMHNKSFEPTGQSAALQLHKAKLVWQILKISGW